MLIRIRARFTINFEAKPPSTVKIDSTTVDLPLVPDNINGTCIMETEVAKIFIFWAGRDAQVDIFKQYTVFQGYM